MGSYVLEQEGCWGKDQFLAVAWAGKGEIGEEGGPSGVGVERNEEIALAWLFFVVVNV